MLSETNKECIVEVMRNTVRQSGLEKCVQNPPSFYFDIFIKQDEQLLPEYGSLLSPEFQNLVANRAEAERIIAGILGLM